MVDVIASMALDVALIVEGEDRTRRKKTKKRKGPRRRAIDKERKITERRNRVFGFDYGILWRRI